jgi:hypothetical protein
VVPPRCHSRARGGSATATPARPRIRAAAELPDMTAKKPPAMARTGADYAAPGRRQGALGVGQLPQAGRGRWWTDPGQFGGEPVVRGWLGRAAGIVRPSSPRGLESRDSTMSRLLLLVSGRGLDSLRLLVETTFRGVGRPSPIAAKD